MKKKLPPSDNPTSAIFDLAEHMSDNYNKVIYLKYYAFIFIGITAVIRGAASSVVASGACSGKSVISYWPIVSWEEWKSALAI